MAFVVVDNPYATRTPDRVVVGADSGAAPITTVTTGQIWPRGNR